VSPIGRPSCDRSYEILQMIEKRSELVTNLDIVALVIETALSE
jgi:hypothetical protein